MSDEVNVQVSPEQVATVINQAVQEALANRTREERAVRFYTSPQPSVAKCEAKAGFWYKNADQMADAARFLASQKHVTEFSISEDKIIVEVDLAEMLKPMFKELQRAVRSIHSGG